MTDIYKCPKCKERFLLCDLIRSKCSENGNTAYMITYCPYCLVSLEKEPEEGDVE